MCGINAVFSLSWQDADFKKFEKLLYFNQTRGSDSTGMFLIPEVNIKESTSQFAWLKMKVKSSRFIDNPYYKGVRSYPKPCIMVGHARAATRGAVTTENAHPFLSKCGKIVGVHNGTLTVYDKYEDIETDSECLINMIAERGLTEALRGVRGAYAIIYWNNEEKSLNIIRNKERSLFYHQVGHSSDMMVASESWMISGAGVFNESAIQEIEPYHHYKWSFETRSFGVSNNFKNIQVTFTKEKIEGLEVPSRANFFPESSYSYGTAYGSYRSWDDWEQYELYKDQERKPTYESSSTVPWNPPYQSRNTSSFSRTSEFNAVREQARSGVPLRSRTDKTIEATGEKAGPKTVVSHESKLENLSEYAHELGLDDGDILEWRINEDVPEKQRVVGNKLQYFTTEWVDEEDFINILESGACLYSGQTTEPEEARTWVSASEFVLSKFNDEFQIGRMT